MNSELPQSLFEKDVDQAPFFLQMKTLSLKFVDPMLQ